jgi:hypothetical protein
MRTIGKFSENEFLSCSIPCSIKQLLTFAADMKRKNILEDPISRWPKLEIVS